MAERSGGDRPKGPMDRKETPTDENTKIPGFDTENVRPFRKRIDEQVSRFGGLGSERIRDLDQSITQWLDRNSETIVAVGVGILAIGMIAYTLFGKGKEEKYSNASLELH